MNTMIVISWRSIPAVSLSLFFNLNPVLDSRKNHTQKKQCLTTFFCQKATNFYFWLYMTKKPSKHVKQLYDHTGPGGLRFMACTTQNYHFFTSSLIKKLMVIVGLTHKGRQKVIINSWCSPFLRNPLAALFRSSLLRLLIGLMMALLLLLDLTMCFCSHLSDQASLLCLCHKLTSPT